jgi:hypothetical protein
VNSLQGVQTIRIVFHKVDASKAAFSDAIYGGIYVHLFLAIIIIVRALHSFILLIADDKMKNEGMDNQFSFDFQ